MVSRALEQDSGSLAAPGTNFSRILCWDGTPGLCRPQLYTLPALLLAILATRAPGPSSLACLSLCLLACSHTPSAFSLTFKLLEGVRLDHCHHGHCHTKPAPVMVHGCPEVRRSPSPSAVAWTTGWWQLTVGWMETVCVGGGASVRGLC